MLYVKKSSKLVVVSSAFVVLIVATAGLIGYVSLQNGTHAVEDVAQQLQGQIFVSIREKLGDYLAMPHRLNRLNAAMMAQQPSMFDDLAGLHPVYLRELQAFETVAFVGVGVETEGNFAGAGRRESNFSINLMNRKQDNIYRVSEIDAQGHVIRVLTEMPDYDPRSRAWYQAAKRAGNAAWSPIYIWATGLDIGITAVLPVYDPAGKMIAVHQSVLTLDVTAGFLKGLKIGKSGQVFLMEQDGMLVASSTSEKLIRKGVKEFERSPSAESADSFIRAASAYLRSQFGDLRHLPDNYHSNLTIDGQRYFLSAASLRDPYGLHWIMVDGLPEADVMEQIDANTRTTIGLCLAASLVAIGLGIIIARRMTAANQRLEREIAERTQAESALRESEERYRKAQSLGHVGNWEYHIRETRFWGSDEAKRIYGFDVNADNFTADEVENCISERERVHQALIDLIEKDQAYHLEFDIITKDTEKRKTIISRAELERDETGRPLKINGVIHDITDRKQAEEALRETRDYLEKLLDYANAPIIVWDARLRMTRFNTAFERLSGYAAAEVIGADLSLLFPPTSRAESMGKIERAARGEYWETVEIPILRKDGGIRIVLWNSSNIYANDGVTLQATIAQGVDITDRKQAEEALRHAKDAADAANQSKSAFLANMSHELRTPLNGILGYAQLLQRDPALPAKQREQSAIIQRSGEHLLTLINDILDLAKVEAGKFELHPVRFDLFALMKDVQTMITVKAEQKGVRFQVEQADDLPQYVEGDEHRIRQILLNLLGNAIKFTDRGGVTLRVTRQHGQRAAAMLCFEVEDTGVGIAPEDIAQLFTPFQQVGDASRQAQGTGLGLAISHNLTALMGGTLTVTSTVGVGSAFSFEAAFPERSASEASRADRRRIVGVQGAVPTILMVDDQAENRQIVVDLLTPLGCCVLEAVNGQDALQQVMRVRPAAIITDLRMPEMDGLTLIQHIRQLPEFQNVIIIASSASVYADDRQRSFMAGSQAFLPKPVEMTLLCDQLEQLGVVTWEYQDADALAASEAERTPPAAVTPEMLDALPETWRTACHHAALEADFAVVLRLLDEIRPEHPALVEGLSAIVHEYRFDLLSSLLQKSDNVVFQDAAQKK